ncbi:MAG: hypothetical protein HOH95_14580 [Dehalococcoidia bacterium]|jgi:hypothetical protein|nr:hypothetical protein [Dehalococcoidia bacterium]
MNRNTTTVARPLIAALLLAALALIGVGCDDADLNQLGAPGAHNVTYTLELGDGSITVVSSEGATQTSDDPLVLASPTHTDFTLILRNAGQQEHSLTLYADEARTLEMARSLPIATGEETRLVVHFHDRQEAYFADESDPEAMSGAIEVREE